MIWTHLAAWLLGAVIAATTAWQVQDWRMGEQIADLNLAHATALAQAQAKALATERAITTHYQGALNEARTREAALQRDVGRARAESDGLRDQAADAARRIATAAPAAVAEYANTVTELFGECSRSYQELAHQADRHSADVRTLQQAWPVIAGP
ncbi:hypothetical protein [Acidovorax sp. A1169]|uniref:hypothetical protein n=1 Tax=Acidovorax sp. A1169 TaxID=3059524 RepID=UPI002737EACF|nr:hypothetical protein [Acidovorax sp. A1169]MDP4076264.1 hypothetical protein [Acidovorax sp. A1169]